MILFIKLIMPTNLFYYSYCLSKLMSDKLIWDDIILTDW